MREAVRAAGYPEVDHIELFAPPHDAANHSRNFVLCPGGEYDRSPCGTGTSAKLACLAADDKLDPGEPWRQESILGSVFEASYEKAETGITPTITGTAFITAESTLILDPRDPFQYGIS
jgi:4-hydroxyproline epimerase